MSAALVSKAGPLSITVANPGGAMSAAATFTVYSKLTILTASLPATQTGAPYDSILTATGGLLPYTWSATGLPAGVTLNPSTGEIRGTWGTAGNYPATVTVMDASGQIASLPYTVVVSTTPTPLQFVTPSSLPAATVGTPYAVTFTASGGTPPYTFTLIGTAPPRAGVCERNFSGTPTTAGTFSLGVTLTDSGSDPSATFQLVVAPAPLAVTGSVGNATVGATLSTKFGATGGVPALHLQRHRNAAGGHHIYQRGPGYQRHAGRNPDRRGILHLHRYGNR